jgi:hypothetical protein
VLAYWGALSVVFAWLLERAGAACPPPDKTLHRSDERQQDNRSLHVFKIFLVIVAVLAVADFFAPEPFHLGFDRAAPLVVGVLVAGFLIAFLGSESWDGCIGWRKSSFWLATFITVVCVISLTQALHIGDPRSFMFPLIAAAIVFFWSFGLLRGIDRNNAEMRSLGVTRELADPLPESVAVVQTMQGTHTPKAHGKNRHKKRRGKKNFML